MVSVRVDILKANRRLSASAMGMTAGPWTRRAGLCLRTKHCRRHIFIYTPRSLCPVLEINAPDEEPITARRGFGDPRSASCPLALQPSKRCARHRHRMAGGRSPQSSEAPPAVQVDAGERIEAGAAAGATGSRPSCAELPSVLL
jgi:hypothetical protein